MVRIGSVTWALLVAVVVVSATVLLALAVGNDEAKPEHYALSLRGEQVGTVTIEGALVVHVSGCTYVAGNDGSDLMSLYIAGPGADDFRPFLNLRKPAAKGKAVMASTPACGSFSLRRE